MRAYVSTEIPRNQKFFEFISNIKCETRKLTYFCIYNAKKDYFSSNYKVDMGVRNDVCLYWYHIIWNMNRTALPGQGTAKKDG